jgi:hypothetical protein
MKQTRKQPSLTMGQYSMTRCTQPGNQQMRKQPWYCRYVCCWQQLLQHRQHACVIILITITKQHRKVTQQQQKQVQNNNPASPWGSTP